VPGSRQRNGPVRGEYLTAPGLLAHVFLTAPRQDAGAGWKHLRSVWHDVTCQFGLDRPVPLLAEKHFLPLDNALPDGRPVVLAAAERSQPEVWQALAWADHDVLCVTAMMAPPREGECAGAWADLEAAWDAATAGLGPDGVLGEARIFLALLAHPPAEGLPDDDPATGRVADLVRAAVPEPSILGWWQHWDTVPLSSPGTGPDGASVWEAGPASENGRVLRRLVAVAAVESEGQVDKLVWTNGDGTPTPLARHLLHAARLRHQIRVFDDGSGSRRLRDELGLGVDDPPGDAAGPRNRARGDTGWDRLSARLEQAQGSAVTLRAGLGQMRDAVAIIDENMRHSLHLADIEPAAGPLSGDLTLAAWFGRRLSDEIGRLDAAVDHARSASSFIAGEGPASIRPLGRARPVGLVSQPRDREHRTGPWVVVFTAIEVEYEAVKGYLAGPFRQHEERGTLYELGSLPDVRGSWRVAVTQTGPGSTTAGVQLERAIPVFTPEIVLFLGVAGGRKDVAIGDVVVADTIYDYEGGKSTLEGYLPRMRTDRPAHRLLQRARLVARENRWQERIQPGCPKRRPASFIKPIVTGGKVVAHDRSEVARLLDQYASDALAVETEGHGFLEGAYVNPGVGALVIRGISDLLAGKDKASDEHWQPVASRHAAAFAFELLDSIGASHA
jgi:nucleoside phosphorylase